MALTPCRECNKSISTEAVSCPHCGAPRQPAAPPLLPSQEEMLYSDNVVAVTNARIIISGATYVLRNITSVRMTYSAPRVFWSIILALLGIIILLLFWLRPDGAIAPAGAFFLPGGMIGGAILWMCLAKTYFHVGLSTAAGELHVLTSKDKAYILQIVKCINSAIIRCGVGR